MAARSVVASLVLVSVMAAHARADDDEKIPGHTVYRPIDGGIQAAAFGIGLAAKLIPLRDRDPWEHEMFDADLGVRDNFSRRASHISDGLLAMSLAAPALYLTGSTIDDVDGDRLLIYGQTMAINAAIASLTKQLVQRPRPYTYSNDPKVKAYAKSEGTDAYMSFYSGHAAFTFAAATTGAYLLNTTDASPVAKNIAWGAGFGVAAMTASLRVRAGKHFYSDVLVGSVVGMSVGFIVPALHADDKPLAPSGGQLAIAGASILGGMLFARLIPLEKRETEDRGLIDGISFAPTAVENGMGIGVVGGW
ncbi:MAG: phosphatase PAP2 family protein [Kofleriaceae bacterium]